MYFCRDMKTIKKHLTTEEKSPHKLPYHGPLRDYASEILSLGRGNGRDFHASKIPTVIINDLAGRGTTLDTDETTITQRQIFKYRNHPKKRKGANLPVEDYPYIEKAIASPANIYADISKKTWCMLSPRLTETTKSSKRYCIPIMLTMEPQQT